MSDPTCGSGQLNDWLGVGWYPNKPQSIMATLSFTVMNRFIKPFVDGHVSDEYKGSGIWQFGVVDCECGVKGHRNFVIVVHKPDDTERKGENETICISNNGRRVCSHGNDVEDFHAWMILQFFKEATPKLFSKDKKNRECLIVDARED